MLCPVCNIEAVISKTSYGYHLKEDGTVDMFMLIKYSCRNRSCKNFQKEIGEERIPLDAGPVE